MATIVGLIVALGWTLAIPVWRMLHGIPVHASLADKNAEWTTLSVEWSVAIAILCIAFFWERLPLGSLGFRMPNWLDLAATVGAIVVSFTLLAIISPLVGPEAKLAGDTPAQIAAIPIAIRILMCLTAGFCEELAFRAYLIERLGMLTGRLWIGATASVILFTAAHITRYGMTSGLIQVFVIGSVLTAAYVWRRNIWVCATAHAAIDAVALLLGPIGHP